MEGNLKTEVVDVNMMLVPDIRKASPEAADRAVAACESMARRNARRYLYEEFTLDDRRELDDATLEILGIADAEERAALMDRLYRDVTDMQRSHQRPGDHRPARPTTLRPQGRAQPHRTSPTKFGTGRDLDLFQFPGGLCKTPERGARRSICRPAGVEGPALASDRSRRNVESRHCPGGRARTETSWMWAAVAAGRPASLKPCLQCHRAGPDQTASRRRMRGKRSAASTSIAPNCWTAARSLSCRGPPTSAVSEPLSMR